MKNTTENLTLEEKIYSYEEENTVIGIGSCEPFYNIKEILENTDIPFVEKDVLKRIDPKYSRETAKSIIALGLSYNKKFVGQIDNKIRGKISIGAMGTDYHILVKEKLEKIKTELNLNGDIFVDTGYLVDREVAKRCNIARIGKSGLTINEKLGSIIFIGYLLVDEVLTPSPKLEEKDLCKDCNICIKCCPSGAILENNKFNYKVCISYLTQCKQLNTEQEKNMIKSQIYGCDICQLVCPYNKGKYYEEIYDLDTFYPDIEKLLFISNKEFNETYKKTASGWRGKKILQRNAIIGLANSTYKKESIALLEKVLKTDNREDIKEYANWAINKLNAKADIHK
ncbi:MAG: tRNA epoxyqueuosine(34) reductase QueG [Eubacteriales bacterium]|nr:tRNA epoxyqueuosine(34) reductase QueG [Eubacteriales bacterium]